MMGDCHIDMATTSQVERNIAAAHFNSLKPRVPRHETANTFLGLPQTLFQQCPMIYRDVAEI